MFKNVNSIAEILYGRTGTEKNLAPAGFLSGRILTLLLGEIKHLELPIFVAIIVIGAAIWSFVHYRR